jgi:primosomal protein N' (replication factor Y)
MQFARVVTDLSLDRTFDYKIPPVLSSLAVPGSRVKVPFGRTHKIGFIIEICSTSDFPHHKIKEISGVVDRSPLVPRSLIELGRWIAKYYCCSIEQAIKVLLPGVIRSDKTSKKRKMHYVMKLVDAQQAHGYLDEIEDKHPKQALVLKKLFQRGEVLQSVLRYELSISDSAIKTLEKRGIVERVKVAVVADLFNVDEIIPSVDLKLSAEQSDALKMINHEISSQQPKVVVLNGVTGSGKTEVYLQALRHCLAQGKEAIVLVPEIALTPQTVERFRSRFGDLVSVLHSGLTDRERFDEWMKIHEKKVSIAVGARSALFAPFHNLGLIVVDEEHESTYKQNETPRYHARDVAVVRGNIEKAAVVLGSATPAFETLYNVKQGKYLQANLTQRHDGQVMPSIKIINLKNESKELGGGYGIFSKTLVEDVYKCLNQGEQVILFLNRRGFATSLQCLKCGYVAECEQCDKAYTYHQKFGQLICHYCNDIKQAPKVCPACGDQEIRFTGLGTERIEELANKIFPKATVARMDSDTMSSDKDYKRVLNQFRSGKVDILIGTQMIAKGLHFPNVTLVGVLLADMGLHIPDFRAGEKTLQLITQVAGRAGRGEVPGRVLVQTLSPFHPALQHAKANEYYPYFEEEIEARELFSLPPALRMVLIHFKGADAELVLATGRVLKHSLSDAFKSFEGTILGEVIPSPMEKIANNYRYQLSIRTDQIQRVSAILRQVLVGWKVDRGVKFSIDVDPLSLM